LTPPADSVCSRPRDDRRPDPSPDACARDRYKWPRKIVFWDALPKSAYGKIPKKSVRQQLVDRGEDRL